jgi:hypothetical protein
MTKKPEFPKSEEERRKEAAKLRAESERSLEAAMAKTAHGLIESIQRGRKSPAVYSLAQRIDAHGEEMLTLIELLVSHEKPGLAFSFEEMERVRGSIRSYESIREDFKEIIEMTDEKLEKLFPKVTTYFENRAQARTILTNIMGQEIQMLAYSLR